jgi:hypothetical protein
MNGRPTEPAALMTRVMLPEEAPMNGEHESRRNHGLGYAFR